MKLRATNRLVTAVLATAAGALVTVMTGQAEAAVIVTPWLVLVVLGSRWHGMDRIRVRLSLDRDRVVVGGPITIEAAIDGLEGGWVEAVWQPPTAVTATTATPTGPTVGSERERPAGNMMVGDTAGRDGRATLRCTTDTASWGTHDVGRIEIRVHHPFGLTVGHARARQPLPVRVHPRPIDLRSLLAPWHVRRLTGAHRSRSMGQGVEYADIRPFGPGDSPRDINWRATARSDEVMVSRRHPDRSTHAILLIDSFTDSGGEPMAMLGEIIEAAVALAESHLSVSDRVGLIDMGGVIRWVTPGSGRHHLERLVDALLATRLFRSEADRSLAAVPALALPPRSFVLALSPLVDRRFVDALFTLRGGGHDVAVVELPPAIGSHPPEGQRGHRGHQRNRGHRRNDDELASVARRLWQLERDVVRDHLTERGIAVTQRHPPDRPQQREPWDHVLHRLTTARRGIRPLAR